MKMKKITEDEQQSGFNKILNILKGTGISLKEGIATFVSFIISAMAFLWSNTAETKELIGRLLILVLLYLIFIFYSGRRITGKNRTDSEVYLISLLVAVYYISCALVRDIKIMDGYMPVSIVLPTALVVMLIAISVDSRLAYTVSLALPLGAFLSGCIDMYAYLAAIAAGVSGSLVLRNARRRVDLVKAGVFVAMANILTVTAALLINDCPGAKYPVILFWAAINGIVSGMLVLGILPIIENALHISTTFKLIELLDVSAPILKKLSTSAPGTWSHSMMVATLAEEACREIGAKALLARVGAYYHDIGKIDQPDYFVENQKGNNKLTGLNPRLSTTVIRSHVKLGVEKARAIGLPNDVIDIISEHHGNSVIQFFYNTAKAKEGDVDSEDFCYPGNPPRTKESATVMLADVTEAATRTLENPTMARLEKFIQGLFDYKIQHGQLAESALTFHDLELIKRTFVRVLVGYHHSRIEYPKEETEK
jgi:putative nucleotidyltransferase with HDIG domain